MMALLPGDTPAVVGLTAQWIVAYKPAGWLTVPRSEGTNPQLRKPFENMLASYPLGILSEWIKERYGQIWITHRIDRETSGLVLFARTAEDHRTANTWFQKHEVRKIYDCLASGVPSAPVFKITKPVGGSHAVTQVEVKEKFKEGFLARVMPLTGRRHQIRVHLSSEGHPLWGDPLYKGPTSVVIANERIAVRRVALHAASLGLPSGEIFEAYWPKDFKEWVERLRAGGERA